MIDELTERTTRARRDVSDRQSEKSSREVQALHFSYLCIAGMIMFGCWACYLGTLPKSAPYVIERSGGSVFYAGPIKPSSMDAQTWDLVKLESLKKFIVEWRTVTTDRSAQESYYDESFEHVGKGSPADAALREWYAANNPFERATAEVVSVEYKTYDKRGDNTYGIWWTETTRSLTGEIKSQKTWQATLPVVMLQKLPEKIRGENALGIVISELSYAIYKHRGDDWYVFNGCGGHSLIGNYI